MNRTLQYVNLAGVVVLAGLCAVQWQTNRRVSLSVISLEKTRLEQVAQLAERDKTAKGYAADLDELRQQLIATHASLKDTEGKSLATGRQVRQLTEQCEQLKTSVTNWTGAVAARDERLNQTYEQLLKAANERNEAVTKFNDLAGKYNGVVKSLNEARAQMAALMASQTNTPAAPATSQ